MVLLTVSARTTATHQTAGMPVSGIAGYRDHENPDTVTVPDNPEADGGGLPEETSAGNNNADAGEQVPENTAPEEIVTEEQDTVTSSVVEEKPVSATTTDSPVGNNGSGESVRPSTGAEGNGEPQRKLVDFRADITRPIKITPDSSAVNLLGNVILYHNGAVVTSDSAVRYSENYMEFFKRVVINQDNTYIYGDRLEYNGETNVVNVYAPIIKVVSDSSELYTYNMTFNTLDKVGEFYGTGTLTQGDNMMESERGYYYVDTREVVGVQNVELTNPEYKMKSDSVRYNLDDETAEFFTTTHVWNDKGEILIADRGKYFNATGEYKFTSNSYILTETQEVWSDSLDYDSRVENVVLRRDIQIRDEENSVMAFGDYGEYWGETEYGMLTREPALVSFDPEQPDTVYMRSDSMFFYTFPADHVFESSLLPQEAPSKGKILSEEELIMPRQGMNALPGETDEFTGAGHDGMADMPENGQAGEIRETGPDTDEGEAENGNVVGEDMSGVEDSPEVSKKTKKEEKAEQRAAKKNKKVKKSEEIIEIPDSGNVEAEDTITHDNAVVGVAYGTDDGEQDDIASATGTDDMPEEEDISAVTGLLQDYLPGLPEGTDSLAVPVLSDSMAIAGTENGDTLQRVMFAYHDVRIFREDFQAVCDSLVAFSKDSTAHLYIDPVLWNDNNQITSDIMDIYTRDEKLYKAEFRGSPFMTSEVDTAMYNQIKGKFMTAWFRDNEIYRHDVKGNAQTHYYMEDEDDDGTKDIIGFLVVESADLAFLIEERQIEDIKFYDEPVYSLYPMDKIPATLDQFLPGFKWEGARRPETKEDVFTRTIRPSKREEVVELPQPEFPITKAITEDKQRMIELGIWRERNDVLSQFTLDFIRKWINEIEAMQ